MRHGPTTIAGLILLLLGGCMSGPLRENPLLLGDKPPCTDNPVYLPQGPSSYGAVFEKVLDAVSGYFPIAYANRYGGEIQTHPVIAGGIFEPWKTSSPDLCLRLRSTAQSIRERAIITIQPDKHGGYFVDVRVLMELEDLAQPSRATAGEATFRVSSTVERQYEVVEATRFDDTWIPIGRDTALEQLLLERILEPECDSPWLRWLNATSTEPAPLATR
jgi:hypothetical protein